jgi:3-methyladenine DNA glycosylase AlkD
MTIMTLSAKAENIYTQINSKTTKLGDLRKIAKDIKKDHELAMELWSTGAFLPRQLAILIMDKKQLSQKLIDDLDQDIQNHPFNERTQLIDWLMANQFTKDKQTIALMESWENSPSALQRRIFWYHQARLRWTGKTPPSNTEDLLASIEERMANEEPEVQWAMNFTAAQIGIHEPELRSRCIVIGEQTGLYKDEKVPKNCTPNYLPEFISIEVAKLKK